MISGCLSIRNRVDFIIRNALVTPHGVIRFQSFEQAVSGCQFGQVAMHGF
jgi:hypothetical protein